MSWTGAKPCAHCKKLGHHVNSCPVLYPPSPQGQGRPQQQHQYNRTSASSQDPMRGPGPANQQLKTSFGKGKTVFAPKEEKVELALPAATWPNLAVTEDNLPLDGMPRLQKGLDDIAKQAASASKTDQDFVFATRHSFTQQKSMLLTNHFAIAANTDLQLYDYRILGLPTGVSRRKARSLIRATVQQCTFLQHNTQDFATDYTSKIVSWKALHTEPGCQPISNGPCQATSEWGPFVISAPSSTSDPAGNQTYSVHFQLFRTIPVGLGALFRHVKGNGMFYNAGLDVDTLNIVLAKGLSNDVVLVKANKFFVKSGWEDLSHSLCTMRGYFYTVKPGMGSILLNLNVATSAFYKPILVSEFLTETSTFPSRGDRMGVLIGKRVYITHRRGKTNKERSNKGGINSDEARVKTIRGFGKLLAEQWFDWQKDPTGTLPPTPTTVANYFAQAYLETCLRCPAIEAVDLGTKEHPAWYPAELLRILPYQMYTRPVPDGLTSTMVQRACHGPAHSRALIVNEGLPSLGLTQAVPLAQCAMGGAKSAQSGCPGLFVSSYMASVPSRKLDTPQVLYGRKGSVQAANWDLRNRQFFRIHHTPFRYYIITSPSRDFALRTTLDAYHKEFTRAVRHQYSVGSWEHVGGGTLPTNMDQLLHDAQSKRANFILLVLAKKDVRVYSEFKDKVDRLFGLHSICVTEGAILARPNRNNPNWSLRGVGGYFGNVAMKANLKAAGINHSVDGISGLLKNTLVLGADVTHPGVGSLIGCPSIAAIVGSVGDTGGKFLGSMRLQNRENKEVIEPDIMEPMVRERILDWYGEKKTLPSNILYYRDGVSEGQYSQVKRVELSAIRRAYATTAENLKVVNMPGLKLTAVVVAKRHHTRLYPQEQKDTDEANNGNCMPGTVVDRTIVSPYWLDFYLQSHQGIKGTARPAHYFVLENEIAGATSEALQTFTHRLCYTYVRSCMGVSYASPAYYADRLCERGRCYLRPFLTGYPGVKGDEDGLKETMETHLKTRRAKLFPRRPDANRKDVKSEAELKQEKADRETVLKALRERTLSWALDEWNRYGNNNGNNNGNPWHKNLNKTMFWM